MVKISMNFGFDIKFYVRHRSEEISPEADDLSVWKYCCIKKAFTILISSMQLHETMFGIFFRLLLLIFFNVCFQMSLLYVCMNSCANSLLAFVWLFPTVRFQMGPQIAYLKGCIVTLVAFVGLFSTVYFQMCLQIACLNGCKITQVAFV